MQFEDLLEICNSSYIKWLWNHPVTLNLRISKEIFEHSKIFYVYFTENCPDIFDIFLILKVDFSMAIASDTRDTQATWV